MFLGGQEPGSTTLIRNIRERPVHWKPKNLKIRYFGLGRNESGASFGLFGRIFYTTDQNFDVLGG